MAYSVCNIVGFAGHLPTKIIKLPLKYLPVEPYEDVAERFKNSCFGHSELLDLNSQKGTFFPMVQVGVTNDMRLVWLTPLLVDESALLGLQFQNLRIDLPRAIISNSTFTCQFVANNSNGEPFVLLDIIDQSFLLLTLRIELSDFIVGNDSHRLGVDNFSEWVNICVPYSFELRSPPFFVRALGPLDTVVSLKDGGLLHFRRLHPLEAPNIFDFADNASLVSLNIMSLLFKGSGGAEADLNGVHAGAAVDIISLSETEFAVLSVTKVLSFWSLDTYKQSRPKMHMGDASELPIWLKTVPNRYLRRAGTRLALLLPSSKPSEVGGRSRFEVVEWTVSKEHLSKNVSFSVGDSSSTSSNDSGVLIAQDFYVEITDSCVNYIFLWKCNTYSFIEYRTVDSNSGEIGAPVTSHTSTSTPLEELMALNGDAEIMHGVFKSGNYDEAIVSAALQVFESNLGVSASSTAPTEKAFRKHVCKTIQHISDLQGVSSNSLWNKFALICEEFKKSSQEALALIPVNNCIVTAQVNGVGVYRTPHFYEEFNRNVHASELASLLNVIASKFSLRVFKQVLSEVRKGQPLSAHDATRYATEILGPKISDNETRELMDTLSAIPDVLDEIKSLVDAYDTTVIVAKAPVGLSRGEGCGLLLKLITVDAFRSIKKSHEDVLLNLFVLLLLCEVNEPLLKILNEIMAKFSSYALMTQIFELSFRHSSSQCPIELNSVSRSENSIFWKCAVEKQPTLHRLILRRDYNAAFDYYCNSVLAEGRDVFLLDVILELLNRNEVKIILSDFSDKLDASLPAIKFIFGLVYLFNDQYDAFFEAMFDYDSYRRIGSETLEGKLVAYLSGQELIKQFLSGITLPQDLAQLARANYYHQLSQLCMAYYASANSKKNFGSADPKTELFKKSVVFQKEAIAALDDSSNTQHQTVQVTYLRNLFITAVEIQEYNEAIQALSAIQALVSASELKGFFSKLIRTFLTHNNVSALFAIGKTELFRQHYLVVDSILLEIANEDLILSNALTCYEYLYSWRLFGPVKDKKPGTFGDIRGAAEALYIFVTRFRLEKDILLSNTTKAEDYKQFKLRILELYKIIINCLKTFKDADDRWLIRRNASKRLAVATVDELVVEYYKWLKELETEPA